jgi:NAD(P)-dependent dehydrogenase (short-subunit alcohol dehydrogenase family)
VTGTGTDGPVNLQGYFRMNGVMVVTGGSRGIGAAVSVLAAQCGYDVCINYHSNEERALQVVREVESHGRRAMAFRANVAREDEVAAMFAATESKLGRPAALVNNAGISGDAGRVDELGAEQIRLMLETNVQGTLLCCKEALLRMSFKHGGAGGAIVNLSSAAARLGAAGRNVYYAASKAAIDTITFGLAQEVALEGVRVNAVSPGMIDTEMQDPKRLAAMIPRLPMGRAGTAAEVARAILWLASDEASYVSGTILCVSGAR